MSASSVMATTSGLPLGKVSAVYQAWGVILPVKGKAPIASTSGVVVAGGLRSCGLLRPAALLRRAGCCRKAECATVAIANSSSEGLREGAHTMTQPNVWVWASLFACHYILSVIKMSMDINYLRLYIFAIDREDLPVALDMYTLGRRIAAARELRDL